MIPDMCVGNGYFVSTLWLGGMRKSLLSVWMSSILHDAIGIEQWLRG